MMAAMECLDANAVQDLMSDALEARARATVMSHLDTCPDCRELVGVLAKETVRESSQPPRDLALEATAAATSASQMELGETVDGTDRTPKLPGIEVGRTLGRYTLVARVGAGAMGIVYRADDKELGRHVAVKVLHRPDGALTERLVREARSMAQVNHPNVVAVYDVGTQDATTYIAIELVDGESLRAWQQRPRSVAEILEVYIAAGRGLGAAHDAGLVHRDFKPDNVLIGKDGRARVTDFGLAAARPSPESTGKPDASRASMAALGDLSLTRSGTVMGTPAYMAPEQFEGRNVDARTDQFNFCVALYEALYGERPFGGKSFDELYEHVSTGTIKPPHANARVSPALRAIILRGLSVKPGDRYPTMDHLLRDLGRDRAKPWRRAAIAAATVAVLVGIGFAGDKIVRERLSEESRAAFKVTGQQVDGTIRLMVSANEANSSQAFVFDAMTQVSTYREDADFGLGDASADAQQLELLHQQLASATWDFARNSAISTTPNVIAIGDYKGRLLYTSELPDKLPLTDLTQLAWVAEALQSGTGNSMMLVPNDDPRLVATRLLGDKPRSGMSFMFTRAGRGGSSLFIQMLDADAVLKYMNITGTMLSILAGDGSARGTVPPELLQTVAFEDSAVQLGNASYQVQAKRIFGPDKQLVGAVVMAARNDGVLSLFPHARAVLAVAMLVAIGVAIAMYVRARQLRA
jgi:serine/threonine protein kinase